MFLNKNTVYQSCRGLTDTEHPVELRFQLPCKNQGISKVTFDIIDCKNAAVLQNAELISKRP